MPQSPSLWGPKLLAVTLRYDASCIRARLGYSLSSDEGEVDRVPAARCACAISGVFGCTMGLSLRTFMHRCVHVCLHTCLYVCM